MESQMTPWLPFVYQYVVGGLLFSASLILLVRTGALRLNLAADRRLLIALISGLLTFMSVHAIWIASVTG